MNRVNKKPKNKEHSSIENQYAVFDSLLEGVQVIDRNWKYIYVNESLITQARMTKEELIGHTMMDKFPGIDQTKMFDELKECMEKHIPKTFFNEFEFSNGTIGFFELRMRPLSEGVLILSMDESERLNTEKLLKESNERFRFVTKATFDAIWDWDLKKDTLFWGEGFRTIFGYGVRNILNKGNSRSKFIHNEDVKRIKDSLTEAIDSGKMNWSGEYRFLKKNGDYAYVVDRVVIIRDAEKAAVRLVGAIQDITSRKLDELQKTIISEINLSFTRISDLKIALNEILGTLINFGEFNFAEVWLLNYGKNLIDLVAKRSSLENIDKFYEDTLSASQFKKGKGLPGHVWANGKIDWWRNIQQHPFFIRKEASNFIGLKTICGMPLFCQDELIGVLILGSDKDLVQSDNLTNFLEGFAFTFGNEIKRKQLEQELTQVFQAAPDIICLIGFDGYLKKINPKMCDLMGYSESELLGVPFKDFVHHEDRNLINEELLHLNERNKPLHFENRCITKEGKVIWFSWAANPVLEDGLIYSVAKDITEKMELQDLLNKSNHLARIGSWEIDLLSNKTFYSDITKEIYEVDSDFVPTFDSGIQFYKEVEDKIAITDAFDLASEKGIPWDMELQIITAKGNDKWVRSIGQSEFVLDKCTRVYGSFQDITRQKLNEIELKELNEKLRIKAEKLSISNAELEQFAYVASHDLQEPLRMVSSFMTQLENKYGDKLDEKGRQYIHFAVDGAKRMRQIILDLLEFSRIGKMEEEADLVDTNKLIDEVLILQRKQIDETNAKVIYKNLPEVKTFSSPLRHVFQNLISNSLKYHKKDISPKIMVSAKMMGDYWQFSVEDNGIGIDSKYNDKIFQIFQRLHQKEEYSGTGIGLALCKKIIENLGGTIWVESKPNEGSKFNFTLPIK